MSTWVLVLASLGLFIGLHVTVVVLILLNRVLRPLREIKRYADDTLEAGLGIARNLDAVDQSARTRELVTTLLPALRRALA
jgi:hypothetical protein